MGIHQIDEEAAQFLAAERPAFAGKKVAAAPVKLRSRAVQGQEHIVAKAVAGRHHRRFDDLQRFFVGWQVGRETAFVSTAVERPRPASRFFKAWNTSTPQRSASRNEPGRTGCTMNSCTSTLLSAWAPPLMMSSSAPAGACSHRRRRGLRGAETTALAWRKRRLWRRPKTPPTWRWHLADPCWACRRGRSKPDPKSPDPQHRNPARRAPFRCGCRPRHGARLCRRSAPRPRHAVPALPLRRWTLRMARRPSLSRRRSARLPPAPWDCRASPALHAPRCA